MLFLAGLALFPGQLTELSAQGATPCAFAPSLEGSVWQGQDSHGESVVYEFLSGGVLAYTSNSGRHTSATWKQDGECLHMDINEGYVIFTGRITGGNMSGEWVQKFGAKWTVNASKKQSGGGSGAGKQWEQLYEKYKQEYGSGRLRDAVGSARNALKAADKAFGPADDRVALTLRELALMLQEAGQPADALPLAQRSLDVAEKAHGKESREYADALNTLGKSYTGMQKYVEAEDTYRQALTTSEKLFGPKDPIVAMLLNNLGHLLSDQDRYQEAEPMLERSLQLLDTEKPDPQTLGSVLNNLAVAKKEIGKLDEARMLYERGLDLMERIGGEEHRMLLPILKNMAILYRAQGWTEEAAETEERIKRIEARPR